MANTSERQSILVMWQAYQTGDPAAVKQMDDLMTAWAGIKAIGLTDPNALMSYFTIGGYHGEPFLAVPDGFWGGYCNHGNVLFPSWHRAYLFHIEKALQSIPGCESVMLPYWDETDTYSINTGVPEVFTNDTYTYANGSSVPNPLKSFTVPVALEADPQSPFKPAGYVTKRFPFSGGSTPEDITYNEGFTPEQALTFLNDSVTTTLQNMRYPNPVSSAPNTNLFELYQSCLTAPNYTVFSNQTSFDDYIRQKDNRKSTTMTLENPHGVMHVAIGGSIFGDSGIFEGTSSSNGDMSILETAGFDPIFFFHHCNVDRMFWIWQYKNNCTTNQAPFNIIAGNVGAIASTQTNATPVVGQTDGEALTMTTPLNPFPNPMTGQTFTTTDIVDITTLGYTYSIGSLDPRHPQAAAFAAAKQLSPDRSQKRVFVSQINRADFKGSFTLSVYMNKGGERKLVGRHVVFSRNNVKVCANCQGHLETIASFGLNEFTDAELEGATFDVEITGGERANKTAFGKFRTLAQSEFKPFTVEVL